MLYFYKRLTWWLNYNITTNITNTNNIIQLIDTNNTTTTNVITTLRKTNNTSNRQ